MEHFLEDCAPIEININKAKLGLIDAKRYLNLVIGDDGVKVSKLHLINQGYASETCLNFVQETVVPYIIITVFTPSCIYCN